MNNKKGLSQVVTTVIFVALAIVAIGIVWAVIQGIITDQSTSAGEQAECFGVAFDIDSAKCIPALPCEIKITRTASGGEINGVKIIINNGTASNSTTSKKLGVLETDTISISGISNVNKVTVSGVVGETVCPSTTETTEIITQ